MSESFFELSKKDQQEALEYVRAETGRPTHLLEKDIWVVWALRTLFEAPIGADLTFKGGTSLSKVYKVIDRFSEDIDLTYNYRQCIVLPKQNTHSRNQCSSSPENALPK